MKRRKVVAADPTSPTLSKKRPETRIGALEAALAFVRDTSEVAARLRAASSDRRWLPERLEDDPLILDILRQRTLHYFSVPERLTVNLICDAIARAAERNESFAFPLTLAFHLAYSTKNAAPLTSGVRLKLRDSFALLLASGDTAVTFMRHYIPDIRAYLSRATLTPLTRVVERHGSIESLVPRSQRLIDWTRPALAGAQGYDTATLAYIVGVSTSVPRSRRNPLYGRSLLLAYVVARDDLANVDAVLSWSGDERGARRGSLLIASDVSDAMAARLATVYEPGEILSAPRLARVVARVAPPVDMPAFELFAVVASRDVAALVQLIVDDRVPELDDDDAYLALNTFKADVIAPYFAAVGAALPVTNASAARVDGFVCLFALRAPGQWTAATAHWPVAASVVKRVAAPGVDAAVTRATFGRMGPVVGRSALGSKSYEFLRTHCAGLLLDGERPPKNYFGSSWTLGDEWETFLASRSFTIDELVAFAMLAAHDGGALAELYAAHEDAPALRRALATRVRARPAFVGALHVLYHERDGGDLVWTVVRAGGTDASRALFVELATAPFLSAD